MRRKVQYSWGLLKSNWPDEFNDIQVVPDTNLQNKAVEYIVDSPAGETVGRGFKTKQQARAYKNRYVPKGFIRIWNPTIKEYQKALSERRQERRFQSLSSGKSPAMHTD